MLTLAPAVGIDSNLSKGAYAGEICGVTLCHRRYGRDRETRSRKSESRAEGLIRLSVSLSRKFPPLLYVRETLQK
jgi:hypothetical protein